MVHKVKYFEGKVIFPKQYGGKINAVFSVRKAPKSEEHRLGKHAKIFDLIRFR